MRLKLHIWRQAGPEAQGALRTYEVTANEHMSFLEMLDVLNQDLIEKGGRPSLGGASPPKIGHSKGGRKKALKAGYKPALSALAKGEKRAAGGKSGSKASKTPTPSSGPCAPARSWIVLWASGSAPRR